MWTTYIHWGGLKKMFGSLLENEIKCHKWKHFITIEEDLFFIYREPSACITYGDLPCNSKYLTSILERGHPFFLTLHHKPTHPYEFSFQLQLSVYLKNFSCTLCGFNGQIIFLANSFFLLRDFYVFFLNFYKLIRRF